MVYFVVYYGENTTTFVHRGRQNQQNVLLVVALTKDQKTKIPMCTVLFRNMTITPRD